MWNLDTGHAEVHTIEHEKTGFRSTCTTEVQEKEARVLGKKVRQEEVSVKQTRDGLLGSSHVEVNHKTGGVVQKKEGLFFTTKKEGTGSLDKKTGEVEFEGEVSSTFGVRKEVQQAAGRGAQVATTQARHANETKLFCSSSEVGKALQDAASQVAVQSTAGFVGCPAGEVLGKIAGSKTAGSVAGEALAAGAVAACMSKGTCKEKLQNAGSAAGTSLALASAHEAANGIAGAGLVGNVTGQALGAAITSDGPLPERLVHAVEAGGQAALVHGAGKALAMAGVPLRPTNLINEKQRKGIEFAGGSMVSVGCRDRIGSAQLLDGSQISKSQHEEGAQLRVGQGLRRFLFWHVWQTSRFHSVSVHVFSSHAGGGTIVSAVAPEATFVSGLASAVGISGNLGETQRSQHVQRSDGGFKQKEETLNGFAGGVDVCGQGPSVVIVS